MLGSHFTLFKIATPSPTLDPFHYFLYNTFYHYMYYIYICLFNFFFFAYLPSIGFPKLSNLLPMTKPHQPADQHQQQDLQGCILTALGHSHAHQWDSINTWSHRLCRQPPWDSVLHTRGLLQQSLRLPQTPMQTNPSTSPIHQQASSHCMR